MNLDEQNTTNSIKYIQKQHFAPPPPSLHWLLSQRNNYISAMSKDHPRKHILFGQGGAVNQHSSNKVYCRFIAIRKGLYQGLKSPADWMLFVQSVLETFHYKGFWFVYDSIYMPSSGKKFMTMRPWKKSNNCFKDVTRNQWQKPSIRWDLLQNAHVKVTNKWNTITSAMLTFLHMMASFVIMCLIHMEAVPQMD